ncbi:MAG: dihydroorotase [Spirochaetales bacterium]|nr:dihydroorotase [Spirochaetales bacterium]
MIDPHVHLRDFHEQHKETVAHGLDVAFRAGLDGVFEMPNTDPPLVSKKVIKDRLDLADRVGVPVFHGVYGGLTGNADQVKEMVDTWKELFPRVVGLKLYAGRSTGTLSVMSPQEQEKIIQALSFLGFTGVLAVHCEKESCFRHELYDPDIPFSHTLLRPPESEVESIIDIISYARKASFKGTLHICHISTARSVAEVEKARKAKDIRITCGITPHHALLYDELMKEKNGHLLRMNPPLRPEKIQKAMLALLFKGKIDWIETDHAPHLLPEKNRASGIPGLPFYPHFIRRLCGMGMSDELVRQLTHSSICDTFRIDIKNTGRTPVFNLEGEYEFDAFALMKV